MNFRNIVYLCFASLSVSAAVITKQEGEKIVYVDGVYDLAHYGHARSFEKARNYAAKHFNISVDKIRLLVGVSDNDGNLKAYKREPIFSLQQRVAQVRSFKGVEAVIPNSPMVTSDDFIEQEGIDLVMHGDDFSEEKIQKYYGAAVQRGIFKTYPYEPGISTTDILNRATLIQLQTLKGSSAISCEDRDKIEQVLQLLNL